MSAVTPLYRVLFVCSGNTCRSPLAAEALRQALGEEGQRVEILSAGILAVPGSPASAGVVEVAHRQGLDFRAHRAQRLTLELVDGADLVLALDTTEHEGVLRLAPEAASRTDLLSDYGLEKPSGLGVPDPFGGSREAYEECLRRIVEHVQRVAPIVLRKVQARLEAEAGSRDRGGA